MNMEHSHGTQAVNAGYKISIKACVHCGIQFSLQSSNQRFCSIDCFSKNRIKYKKEYRVKITKICERCRLEFQPILKSGRFCSRLCGVRSRPTKKELARCAKCSKEWLDYPFNNKRSKTRYCSQKCFGLKQQGKIAHNKGKKGIYKWTPEMRRKHAETIAKRKPLNRGLTYLNKQIRGCPKYYKYRSDCFERDDYTCKFCGIRGTELNADHYPKSFASILEKCAINTLEEALKCEELWDLSNIRTLCKPCHMKTDTYRKPVKGLKI